MGDDAELWMETGGDPTILIDDRYEYGYDYYDDDYDIADDEVDHKKKNTMVFIDAESIGSSSCPRIIGQCKTIGELYEIRYYARQKDESTLEWKDVAKQYDIKPILLCGGPEHNKVDNKIIKDIKKVLKGNKSIDIFCIASRDGDFTSIVKELRESHKRVVVFATSNTSKKLKASASEVKGI